MDRDFAILNQLDETHVKQLQTLYRQTWWANQRELDDIFTMLEHSDYNFGLVHAHTGLLVGYARVLTDRVYKAMIYDLILDEDYRGRGLGKHLLTTILNHPDLCQVNHVELYCHPEMKNWYRQWGFEDTDESVALVRCIR